MFWLLSDRGEVRGKLATVGRGAICSCRSSCRIGNRRSLGCICRLCFCDLNAPLRIGCAIVELCFVGCTPAFGCPKTSQSQRIGLNCSRIVEVVALRHVVANHRPVADIRPAFCNISLLQLHVSGSKKYSHATFISQFLLFLLLRNNEIGFLMKLIQRIEYINRLLSVVGTPDIKVITGIRRSGKSKLMDMFMERLKKENRKANVIHVNFNDPKSEPLAEYHALYDFVQKKYKQNVPNFVFIDEVQMCKGFEKAINGLHATEKFDIYITGSNAFLLSSDLATLFTGRTFAIEMFPFSFVEFMRYYELTDIQGALDRYLKGGGMAGSYVYNNSTDKYKYIKDVFDTLVLRDIVKKYNIRNKVLLERLCDFLSDNISNITSLRSISDALTSSKVPVNDKTIGSYVGYLCNAFAFYKVRKYDIRGKKYLASQDKYYLGDHSFKYARLGTKNMDYGRAYENIVAIELLRRGYEIYAGFLYKKEIDFVALKKDEKIYIQVSDDISTESTFDREVSPLLKIHDAYPKMIIARTKHEPYQYEGIRIVDLAEWLSNRSIQ